MKNLSIRAKITVWFSALIILITVMMLALMLLISRSVLYTDIKETLVNTVEINSQEIEYCEDINDKEQEIGDHYIQYKGGYLEIDDDFLNESRGVYTSLYDSQGNLLYGENPTGSKISVDGKIQRISYNDEKYYVYNISLKGSRLDGLILLGQVNENANKTVLTRIVNMSLFILPALAVLAIAGGYFLAGRFLKPIRRINASAESITDGNDLSKRIELGKSKDELYTLADTFNKMFSRLERSFEEEKQFTSDVSHELRTPVATILAQSELTLEKERTAEEYQKALSVIKRQSIRMKNIVEQMLQFSRLERLEALPNPEEVNLSLLFNNVAEEQRLRSVRSITIHSDIDDGIKILGNSDLLASLMNNLISNAYRYGKDNGNIYLSLKQNEKEVILTVKDDGIGIDDDVKEKIFNRFYQADRARTVKDSEYGIGLGLSMVSTIAKLHGGYIEVESKVGEGSAFSFKILKK
ncbi:MAG: sensor histidine kinase [Eubacterium sp.]